LRSASIRILESRITPSREVPWLAAFNDSFFHVAHEPFIQSGVAQPAFRYGKTLRKVSADGFRSPYDGHRAVTLFDDDFDSFLYLGKDGMQITG
jgi:hypothetical protein